MTSDSRVEVVAKAMCHADGIRFDDLGHVGWYYWLKLAKAAIEANDAWLAEDWTTRRELFNEQMRSLIEKRYVPGEPDQ